MLTIARLFECPQSLAGQEKPSRNWAKKNFDDTAFYEAKNQPLETNSPRNALVCHGRHLEDAKNRQIKEAGGNRSVQRRDAAKSRFWPRRKNREEKSEAVELARRPPEDDTSLEAASGSLDRQKRTTIQPKNQDSALCVYFN